MNAADDRPRVVMLVKNSFVFDARVRKEAHTLCEAGWEVTVVALHVPGSTALQETTQEGIRVRRVPQLFARRPGWLGPATATPVLDEELGAPRASLHRRHLLVRLASGLAKRVWSFAAPPVRRLNRAVVDRRMLQTAVQLRPGVVHAHDLNTLSVGRRTARRTGARLVYDAHEFHRARNGMGRLAALRAGRLEDRLAPSADLVITATDSWADRLQQLWGGARPLVLRNIPARAKVEGVVDLRGHLSIPPKAPILIYVGSIQAGRGIEEAISALHHLPQAHLVVLGYGAHRPELERIRHTMDLRQRVHFPGAVENRELIRWLAAADVGLCLIRNTSYSYYTSLPNKLFDYIQAQLPVVASDFPEMGAIVRSCGVGELCDPHDAQSIANAITTVLAERERFQQALQLAAQVLTWEVEAELLEAAYGRLTFRSSATLSIDSAA